MICACCCKDKECAETTSSGVTVRHCMDCLNTARKMLAAALRYASTLTRHKERSVADHGQPATKHPHDCRGPDCWCALTG